MDAKLKRQIELAQAKLLQHRAARGIPADGNAGRLRDRRRRDGGTPQMPDLIRYYWKDRPEVAAKILEKLSKAS